MKKLVIYGTGLIAEVADFYFTQDTDYTVAAFLNAADFIEGDSFQGRPLAAFENAQVLYPPAEYDIFIALGYTKTNQVRQARYLEAKQNRAIEGTLARAPRKKLGFGERPDFA